MRIMYKEQPKIGGGGLTPLKIIFQKLGGGGAGAPKLAGGKPHDRYSTLVQFQSGHEISCFTL